MTKALYRKYRSKNLDELVGQEHITKTLKNSLKSGKISHAYLLSGPRGVGKTSIARILAHEFNNLKYDDELLHLDIIEIDAASNRRIEEVRDLREKVHIAPSSLKYKVYIIDEAHMLTKEAFNALLKTLEEPPSHCIFILATTEAYKLPETIISRTQHYSFKPVDEQLVAQHLSNIAKKENIKISDEALLELARHSGGSFRDAISMLDQLRHFDKNIKIDHVEMLLGVPPKKQIQKLFENLRKSDVPALVELLQSFQVNGYDPRAVSGQLFGLVKNFVIQHSSLNNQSLISFSKKLLKVPTSSNPSEYLELICLEYAGKRNESYKADRINITSDATKATETPKIAPNENFEKSEIDLPNSSDVSAFSLESWPQILDKLKSTAPALYTVLRLARASFENNILKLSFGFNLHYKKAITVNHKKILSDAIYQTANSVPQLEYQIDKNLAKTDAIDVYIDNQLYGPQKKEDEELSTINNIFGNAEVLES